MDQGFFADRSKALEDEFFYKVDQELKRKLREKMESEKLRTQLAAATGLKDEAVLNELVALKLSPETVMALSLVPLVRVAWADGTISPDERDAVLKAADSVGHSKGTPSYQLLETWLGEKPGDQVFAVWKDYISALGSKISPSARDALRKDLLKRARSVAESAGGFLGIGKISAAEEAVLDDLDRAFADIGAT